MSSAAGFLTHVACYSSQGFTFGKAGEILTKRLRYMVFRSMLRQVCVLRIGPGCARGELAGALSGYSELLP